MHLKVGRSSLPLRICVFRQTLPLLGGLCFICAGHMYPMRRHDNNYIVVAEKMAPASCIWNPPPGYCCPCMYGTHGRWPMPSLWLLAMSFNYMQFVARFGRQAGSAVDTFLGSGVLSKQTTNNRKEGSHTTLISMLWIHAFHFAEALKESQSHVVIAWRALGYMCRAHEAYARGHGDKYVVVAGKLASAFCIYNPTATCYYECVFATHGRWPMATPRFLLCFLGTCIELVVVASWQVVQRTPLIQAECFQSTQEQPQTMLSENVYFYTINKRFSYCTGLSPVTGLVWSAMTIPQTV